MFILLCKTAEAQSDWMKGTAIFKTCHIFSVLIQVSSNARIHFELNHSIIRVKETELKFMQDSSFFLSFLLFKWERFNISLPLLHFRYMLSCLTKPKESTFKFATIMLEDVKDFNWCLNLKLCTFLHLSAWWRGLLTWHRNGQFLKKFSKRLRCKSGAHYRSQTYINTGVAPQ